MKFQNVMLMCMLYFFPGIAGFAQQGGSDSDTMKEPLSDSFFSCINQSVENDAITLKKMETDQYSLALTCHGTVAEELFNIINPYKIHEIVQKIPEEHGGGFVESLFFGQVTTTYLNNNQVLRTKGSPGSHCSKTYQKADGEFEEYTCIIQIDLFSDLARDLNL